MLKVTTPSKMPVHNSVDNLVKFPQWKILNVDKWVFHMLYTRFPHGGVDI